MPFPLPNPNDPSDPGNVAPLFADVDAVRGDQLRAAMQLIWGNFDYIETNFDDKAKIAAVAALLTGFVSGSDATITATDSVLQAFAKTQGQITAGKASISALAAKITAPTSVTPTLTGFGTVAGLAAYTWRVGPMLFFEYTWTNGTTTGTEARASLRFNDGSGEVDVTTAGTYPTLQLVGEGTGGSPNAGGTGFGNTKVLAEASKTYLVFSAQIDGIISGFTKYNGDRWTSATAMAIRGAVRIQGW